jgi:transcription-repair coupling factor (superfamily II helicase)
LKKSIYLNQQLSPWLSSSENSKGANFSLVAQSISHIQLLIHAAAADHSSGFSAPGAIMIVSSTQSESQQLQSAFRHGIPDDRRLVNSYEFFSPNLWGTERFGTHQYERQNRLQALDHLNHRLGVPVIFTTLLGLLHRVPSKKNRTDQTVEITVNELLDFDRLEESLLDLGYIEAPEVLEFGTFAIRGGILDIYPPLEMPVRLEFFGDRVQSIRRFSPETQRSVDVLERLNLSPCEEFPISRANRSAAAQKLFDRLIEVGGNAQERQGVIACIQKGLRPSNFDLFAPLLSHENGDYSIIDYFQSRDCLFWVRPFEVCQSILMQELDLRQAAFERDIQSNRLSVPPAAHFLDVPDIRRQLHDLGIVQIEFEENSIGDASSIPRPAPVGPSLLESLVLATKNLPLDAWIERFQLLLNQDYAVIVVDPSRTHLKRFVRMMSDRGFSLRMDLQPLHDFLINPGNDRAFSGCVGDLSAPFFDSATHSVFLPLNHVFSQSVPKGSSSKSAARLSASIQSFRDLQPNDFVVHIHHGIGQYHGLVNLCIDENPKDFLLIEYAGKDKIYVPVDGFNLIKRYHTVEDGSRPTVDRLGSNSWSSRTSRTKSAIKDIAADLLAAHAKRQLAQSHSFSSPGEAYFQFEEEFPFEETPDQLTAIQEINADLSSPKAMDRLLCGDVGFGKTEVAMRAAMRAVIDGFQVVVLVPTTVLCYQHFETFRSRFANVGVTIAQLNRFVSAKDEKMTIEGLECGKIDIIIGTHRLLSSDISLRKLGLLIVDEEQRFGVVHKEKIKQLQSGVDTLTLSATPIPRTMHMAMLGLRDLSIISHAPPNRRAVQTFVADYDDQLIAEAIQKEMQRGGQVFFIHNKIHDISDVTTKISKLLDFKVTVKFAHGQMKQHQLEQTIVEFIAGKFPVLVCTAIVESGVDMPKVNTLIIDHADQFGLSQLYQLRGRVGRGAQQAFAYLLVPNTEKVSDDARKRLETIISHQGLGAGFSIASRDLEIRGAGSLLGSQQSGHLDSVGLDLYTEMLREAIESLEGIEREAVADTEIKIPVTAFIPNDYIDNERQRLNVYRTLFSVSESSAIEKEWIGIVDRFGSPPPEVERLRRLAHLKLQLRLMGVSAIHRTELGIVELRFGKLTKRIETAIGTLLKNAPESYQLLRPNRLLINLYIQLHPNESEQVKIFDDLGQKLVRLAELINEKELPT